MCTSTGTYIYILHICQIDACSQSPGVPGRQPAQHPPRASGAQPGAASDAAPPKELPERMDATNLSTLGSCNIISGIWG